MTNAIVLNTLTGAVSEYDNFLFQSITPTLAGNVNGLFSLGGDTDNGQNIDALVLTGKTQCGTPNKKRADIVYFGLVSSGQGTCWVQGLTNNWSYDFPVMDGGKSRKTPGGGIKETFLGFGYANVAGVDFRLDSMEAVLAPSATRKV